MRERVPLCAAALVAAALVATGCGGSGGEPGATTTAPIIPTWTQIPDPGPPPSWLGELRQQYAAAWPAVSEYQRDLLDDADKLTFAEYEASVFAEVQCLRDAGLEIYQAPAYDELQRRFDLSVSSGSGGPSRAVEAGFDRCHNEHTNFIAMVWQDLNPRTAAEIAEASAFLAQCLVDEGFPDAPAPGSAAYHEWHMNLLRTGGRIEDADFCAHNTNRKFGFIPE